MKNKISTSPSRAVINATVLAMLGCPAKGYKYNTVSSVAIIDGDLMSAAILAALQAGQSFTFVHIPVEWDVSGPLIAHAVTALDVGMTIQRNLRVWQPATRGPSLLLDDRSAYAVTKDGLVEVALPLGLEATTHAGFARAVRRMIAAVSAAPGVSLAA